MQYAIVLVLTAIHNEALWSVFEVEDFLWILADSLYFPLNLLTLILRGLYFQAPRSTSTVP